MMSTLIDADAAKLAGLQVDTLHKVRSGQITFDHWTWFNGLTKQQRDAFSGNATAPAESVKPAPQTILRLLSANQQPVLDATDGTETIATATAVFHGNIDPDFDHWGTNEPSEPTKQMEVEVYELLQDATLTQIFGSLNPKLWRLCLTQAQIIDFVVKYRHWLGKGRCATLFLFEAKVQLFVADVRIPGINRTNADLYRINTDGTWDADTRHRVVVPKL